MADPLFRPLPPTSAPSNRQRSNLSHITLAAPEVLVQPRQRAHSDDQKQISAKLTERDLPKSRKHRPLSWFSHSASSVGQKWPLPKDSSASTVGASVISAPVLTSTTNVKVALTEGVHCGKMTASGLAESSWQPKSGWVTDQDAEGVPKHHFHDLQEVQSPNDPNPLRHQRSLGISETPKGHSKRSASMHALSKVKDALATRLRQASDPQTYRSVFKRDKFVRLGDECRPTSPTNERLARIRTEGWNLGRGKIAVLTGHGNMRRKPIRHNGHDARDNLIHAKQKFSVDASDTSHTGRHRTDQSENTLDFKFEDLETSFTKAVENLDFRVKRDKASFASLSSLFHSARSYPVANQTKGPQSPDILPSGPSVHLSSNTEHLPHKLPSQSSSDQFRPAEATMGHCASQMCNFSSGRAKAGPGVYSFPYQAYVASEEESAKADRSARAQRVFSRGHSNPLASHPDLTNFAAQPASPTCEADMPRGTPDMQGNREELDLSGLKGAPIYSPSLENFSQYDRDTPSTVPGSTNVSARRLHTVTSQMPLIDTPTRPSGRGTCGSHTAPKHNWTLVGTPSSEAPSRGGQLDKKRRPRPRVMQSRELIYGQDSHSERALTSKDPNAVLGPDRYGNDNGSIGAISPNATSNVI
jgi:hypothetical protein